MHSLYYFILGVYGICLLFIFMYSLSQFSLLLKVLHRNKRTPIHVPKDLKKLPLVCVQLPIYNEKEMVTRLLEAITSFDYPSHLLEIQVLDDSTDASLDENKALVEAYKNQGFNILHLHQENREGFKAGALKNGLKHTNANFIAIFDADFLPKPNWLKQSLPHFEAEQTGVVQTRWAHVNEHYGMITRVQALALDFHFRVEQVGRSEANLFLNFNGTAGIWRRSCIEDAGNWQGDTLTEDLDLSYRAQLRQWKICYLENVETPAELPIFIEAARSQQFRWNKGAAENFRLNFAKVARSQNIRFRSKFHAFFHLLNSSMFFVILVLAVLSLPILYLKQVLPEAKYIFYAYAFLGSSTLLYMAGYGYAFFRKRNLNLQQTLVFLGTFLAFFSLAMGFSVNNTKAILEGHLGKKTSFIRTPKFNVFDHSSSSFREASKRKIEVIHFIEAFLALYFMYAIVLTFQYKEYAFLPFYFMLLFGFGYISLHTFLGWKKS